MPRVVVALMRSPLLRSPLAALGLRAVDLLLTIVTILVLALFVVGVVEKVAHAEGSKMAPPDKAVATELSRITAMPETSASLTYGTVAALALPDLASPSSLSSRRVTAVNEDSSGTLCLFFVPAGVLCTATTIEAKVCGPSGGTKVVCTCDLAGSDNGIHLAPAASWDNPVAGDLRVCVIASEANVQGQFTDSPIL